MLGIGPRSIVSRPPLWLLLSGSESPAVLNGAQTLLDGETQGLAFDFTDSSAYIIDTGTPANNYDSTGIVSSGSLVGPSGKLVYTSASNKLTLQSDGVMRYQAHNLILQSEDFTSGSWLKQNLLAFGAGSTANAIAAPDGTITADLITPDTANGVHRIYQNFSAVQGAEYTWRISVKAAGYSRIGLYDAVHGTYASFLLSGSGSVLDQGGTAVGAITAVGDDWYDLQYTVASSASGTRQVGVYVLPDSYTTGAPNGVNWTPDGASGVYLWGVHVYRYPANTDYIRTTDAAKYSLPLEYDTSGNCLGLLVEEARTNLCLRSTDFSTTWVAGGSSGLISANTIQSPSGVTDADTLYDNSAGGSGQCAVLQVVTITATNHVFSVFAKASGCNWIALRTSAFDAASAASYFNVSTGALGTKDANHSAYGIEDVGNGWYRCYVVFSSTTDLTGNVWVHLAGADVNLSVDLDGASSAYLWGAQLEAGSFPTSPVVTYSAAASRLVDDITIARTSTPLPAMTGASDVLSGYAQFDVNSGNIGFVFHADNGTANDRFGISTTTAPQINVHSNTTDAGGQTFAGTSGTVANGSTQAAAWRWKVDDCAISYSDGSSTQDTDNTVDLLGEAVTTIRIGSYLTSGNQLNAPLRKLVIVPSEWSNATLETKVGK